MRKDIVTILPVVFFGLLMGCAATLSKNECLEADWYEIGYIDGSEGEPRSLFQKHAENCLQYKLHVGREAYYRGRGQGLKIYCTKDKGFKLGRLGKKYNPICPQDLASGFNAGYARGKKIYDSELRISSIERRLQLIETQIRSKEKQLHLSDISEERKAELRADIKDLELEHWHTVRDLKYWEERKQSE